jgi:hypothetical protein
VPVRCRQIIRSDIDSLVLLLNKGFSQRDPSFWRRAIQRLDDHRNPPNVPKYGYVLESNGSLVGLLLLIHSSVENSIRCYTSGFYVEPEFRPYGPLLDAVATARKDVTYINITALPQTRQLMEPLGFVPYVQGSFIFVPALCRAQRGVRVTEIVEGLPAWEAKLLQDHTGHGCLSLVCLTSDGAHPFVFAQRKRRGVKLGRMTYCRSQEDFLRFSSSLGRYLAWRRFLLVSLNANEPISGLSGVYRGGWPKYYKGSNRPRLCDESYSDRVLFNF